MNQIISVKVWFKTILLTILVVNASNVLENCIDVDTLCADLNTECTGQLHSNADVDLCTELWQRCRNIQADCNKERYFNASSVTYNPDIHQHTSTNRLLASLSMKKSLTKVEAKKLILSGANVHARTFRNATALMLAVSHQIPSPELIETLLLAGADPNEENSFKETTLHLLLVNWSVASNNQWNVFEQTLDLLLKFGGDSSLGDQYGQTPLHIAVSTHNLSATEAFFIRQPFAVEACAVDIEGRTALHIAVAQPMWTKIVSAAILADKSKTSSNTASHLTSLSKDIAFMNFESCIDIFKSYVLMENKKTDNDQGDELSIHITYILNIFSACGFSSRIVRALLENGASKCISKKDASGLSPIELAVDNVNIAAVRELLKYGVRDTATDMDDIINIAIARGSDSIVKLLSQSTEKLDVKINVEEVFHVEEKRNLALSEVQSFNIKQRKIHGDGGWSFPFSSPGGQLEDKLVNMTHNWNSNYCNLDQLQIADVDFQRFWDDYVTTRRPVILKGALSDNAGAWTNWQRMNIKETYGSMIFQVGRQPYPKQVGQEEWSMSLSEYMQYMHRTWSEENEILLEERHEPKYIFQFKKCSKMGNNTGLIFQSRPIPNWADDLGHIEAFKHPNIQPRHLQFYLGPPLSGAPMHFHGKY